MRSSWWVYAVVAAVAAVAGLAIAGLPDGASIDATIAAPEITTTTTTTIPATTTTSTTTTTTIPATTTTSTTTTTTIPATTTTSTTTTTTPPVTQPPTTVPPTTQPLRARSDLYVVVANGGDAPGIAGDAVAELRELGYDNAFKTNGLVAVDTTIVYFDVGFRGEAARLAADLGLPADAIAPLGEAPDVQGSIGPVELLPYLGRDWA